MIAGPIRARKEKKAAKEAKVAKEMEEAATGEANFASWKKWDARRKKEEEGKYSYVDVSTSTKQ